MTCCDENVRRRRLEPEQLWVESVRSPSEQTRKSLVCPREDKMLRPREGQMFVDLES